MKSDDAWAWRCRMLPAQDGVYVSKNNYEKTWKETFLKHWQLRSRWLPATDLDSALQVNFTINVAARFRPLPKTTMPGEVSLSTEQVIIPLHQRLRLIKAYFQCDGKILALLCSHEKR